MSAVSMNQYIQHLEFENCGINLMNVDLANKVKHIVSKNCSLQKINFAQNQIEDSLISDIEEQLKQNKNINDIIFSSLKKQNKEALQRMQKKQIEKKEKIKKKFKRDYERLTYTKMGIQTKDIKLKRKTESKRRSVFTTNLLDRRDYPEFKDELAAGKNPFKTHESEGEVISSSTSDEGDDGHHEDQQQVLNLRGKGLSDLNFLEKFM